MTIRRSPNARWVFDPGEGFNCSAMKLVVQTRNAAGIAAGADIVVNYGAAFDFMLGKSQGGEAKFIGLLEEIFKGQQKIIEEHRAECDGHDAESEKKQKKEDLESEQKTKHDAEQKTKAEAERKRTEAAEKIKADGELKRKRGEVVCVSEEPKPKALKASAADSSVGGTGPSASGSAKSGESAPFVHEHGVLQLSGSSWVIKANGPDNKKIPKHSLLGWAGSGSVMKASKCDETNKKRSCSLCPTRRSSSTGPARRSFSLTSTSRA